MPKRDNLRRIDNAGHMQNRDLLKHLSQQFITSPGAPLPDGTPPGVPQNLIHGFSYMAAKEKSAGIHATFQWTPNTEPDLEAYLIKYRTEMSTVTRTETDWVYLRDDSPAVPGPIGSTKAYTLENLPYGASGSIAIGAVDIWGNKSAFSKVVEFDCFSPPYWDGIWGAPTPIVSDWSYSGRDVVFVVEADSDEYIAALVWDIMD